MKKVFIKIFFPVVLSLFLIACEQEMTQEDYMAEIEAAEAELQKDVNDQQIYQERALRAGRAYKNYLEKFPQDTANRAEYLSNAAQLYARVEKYDTSLALIDTLRTHYPQSEESANMLHFKGFYIYEEGLQDRNKAEQTYLQFLDEYPAHELVPAVLFSLENLGKSDAEVLDAIRNKNNPDQYP